MFSLFAIRLGSFGRARATPEAHSSPSAMGRLAARQALVALHKEEGACLLVRRGQNLAAALPPSLFCQGLTAAPLSVTQAAD